MTGRPYAVFIFIALLGNRADRTYVFTSAAVSTSGSINLIFVGAFTNRFYRALSSARTAGNALITNFMSHVFTSNPSIKLYISS
jgi:hypothetical protein